MSYEPHSGQGLELTAARFWDKEHYSHYHSFPSHENRERLVGLAVAERGFLSLYWSLKGCLGESGAITDSRCSFYPLG